ncbi:hypothetical protein GY45DRAFT_1227952, partial [Cubamyces sp. BRFM 1775]
YKLVARKVRSVPTNMPDLSAQVFKPIHLPTPPPLPIVPPSREDLVYSERLTRERVELILSSIPEGFLRDAEVDLLAYVLIERQMAIAFSDDERGTFNREYFPDYVIPVIEHTPWVRPPIPIPKAIVGDV